MAKYKLKEFITQLRGVSYKPTDVTDKNNGTPVLRANNIQDEGLIYDDLVYLKPDKIKENQKLIAGDIVICASSGSKSLVGKASIFTQNSKVMSFGAFCKAVRVKDIEGINKDFIRLFFSSKSYREQISASSVGANINNIKTENIDDLDINIPTSETQAIAVKILTHIKKAIFTKKEQLKQLDELVKSRFIEMFENKNFEEKKWFDVVNIINGKDYKKIPNISGTYPIYGSGGYMGIRCDQYLCNENSVIIGRKGNVTNPIFVKEKYWNVDTAFGIETKDCLNPYYFYYHTLTVDLSSLVSGAAIPSMTKTSLQKIKIIVPPIELQNSFAGFVKQVDKSKFVVSLA